MHLRFNKVQTTIDKTEQCFAWGLLAELIYRIWDLQLQWNNVEPIKELPSSVPAQLHADSARLYSNEAPLLPDMWWTQTADFNPSPQKPEGDHTDSADRIHTVWLLHSIYRQWFRRLRGVSTMDFPPESRYFHLQTLQTFPPCFLWVSCPSVSRFPASPSRAVRLCLLSGCYCKPNVKHTFHITSCTAHQASNLPHKWIFCSRLESKPLLLHGFLGVGPTLHSCVLSSLEGMRGMRQTCDNTDSSGTLCIPADSNIVPSRSGTQTVVRGETADLRWVTGDTEDNEWKWSQQSECQKLKQLLWRQ